MAAHHTIRSLSPQLAPELAPELTPELAPALGNVLGSLNISLESELNRYRRNRRINSFDKGLVKEEIFTDVESDPAFDVEPVEAALALPLPPVPPNKKLIASQSLRREPLRSAPRASSPELNLLALPASAQLKPDELQQDEPNPGEPKLGDLKPDELAESSSSYRFRPVGSLEQTSPSEQQPTPMYQLEQTNQSRRTDQAHAAKLDDIASDASVSALLGPVTEPHEAIAPPPLQEPTANSQAPNSYLTSSKALIETLEEQSTQPNASDPTTHLPKRKTVSLLAGATVAFLGLVGGLGASYFMSDPLVAQRLASELQANGVEAIDSVKAFDPPGPDLSAAEFVELEIDNLSSLQMPRATPINPGEPSPAGLSSVGLPPTPTIPAPASVSTPEAIPSAQANVPSAAAVIGSRAADRQSAGSRVSSSQSVMLPVGLTYYVTVPFTSESGLRRIRETTSEAFVRRFSDGNRIQVAAFNNAQSAQQFIKELAEKNISAEVYGPTTE
ncbi:MAG: hypothetical protein AAF716_05370 [Cyanobacteria bacterium P01_D01_bin.1]